MAMLDFGKLTSVIRDVAISNANRNTSPLVSGPIGTASHNLGNTSDGLRESQILIGSQNTFLWAVHEWDDGTNKVI